MWLPGGIVVISRIGWPSGYRWDLKCNFDKPIIFIKCFIACKVNSPCCPLLIMVILGVMNMWEVLPGSESFTSSVYYDDVAHDDWGDVILQPVQTVCLFLNVWPVSLRFIANDSDISPSLCHVSGWVAVTLGCYIDWECSKIMWLNKTHLPSIRIKYELHSLDSVIWETSSQHTFFSSSVRPFL